MMNKKGALELSITAIVVIVVAFVVLGLGLTLTRTIFKGAQERLPAAFDLTNLEAQPTSENPITIPDRIEIGRGKTKEMNVGFYNTQSTPFSGVRLTIKDCQASSAQAQQVLTGNPGLVPTVTSIAQRVEGSQAAGYKIIMTENGLLGGNNYICTIVAVDAANLELQTKQFFLYVTS